MEVTKLVKTCDWAPSQWEGELKSGLVFYVRYRHTILTCGFGANLDDAVANADEYERQMELDEPVQWKSVEPLFQEALGQYLQ